MIWRWQLFNDDGDKYSYRYVFYFCTESIFKVFQNAGDTVKNIPSWFYAGRKSLKTSDPGDKRQLSGTQSNRCS